MELNKFMRYKPEEKVIVLLNKIQGHLDEIECIMEKLQINSPVVLSKVVKKKVPSSVKSKK
jgi:hypothetical protein